MLGLVLNHMRKGGPDIALNKSQDIYLPQPKSNHQGIQCIIVA